ncbi:MAG: secretin N-terminal domain-containing protein [Verrucomicrobiales bacterium]
MLALVAPVHSQDRETPAADGEPMTDVQMPNTPIPMILLEYERLTGNRVIRDANVQDQTLSVQTSGKMTYGEAARFIEKSFLLNGYAILPTEEPDQMKIIAFNVDKRLSSEGLPVITSAFQLPESDQVVTYIMPLSYLAPEEAAEVFSNIVDLHPYGSITPLRNASALVITESSNVIRRFIELRDHLDVSPLRTVSRSFQLERADAEDVAEALIDILDLDQESGEGASRSRERPDGERPEQTRSAPRPEPTDRIIPSQVQGGAAFAKANAPKPRVRAIPRANRVLVVAAPQDIEYIEGIVDHLDAPVETANYIRRKLLYIPVSDFLQIAGDVILRGIGNEDGQTGEISGRERDSRRGGDDGSGGDGFASDRGRPFGSQGGLGSNSGSRGTGDLGDAGSDEAAAPQSIVIDKTLLIADNVQNMLIASGPPEHLALICELLDAMDCRPEQIQISAVIAQLNLGDDFEFGFDLLRSFESPADGSSFNGGGSFASRTGESQRLLDVSTLTDVTNLLPAAQGLTFYGQVNPYLDTFLAALDSTNRFKVLSRPTVYTQNNRRAVIETGQRVAVPRSTLSSLDVDRDATNQIVTANIDYIDVVLSVSVVPLINAEGAITLQIKQKNDSIVGSQIIGGDAIPTIATQTLGTTIIVEDGGTVLLGGLISESDEKNESGLPLFANLPLVGRVFGSTNDSVSRQELLIFIQPKIIKNAADQFHVDRDLTHRTRVGTSAEKFAVNADNNLDVFESQDFNSPEKRIHFFRDLFKKKPKAPTVRAVPIKD